MRVFLLCIGLLFTVFTIGAQEDVPRFEDIFVTDFATRIDAPYDESVSAITLPQSVEICPQHSAGRLHAISPNGQYLIYSDCLYNGNNSYVAIHFYDTQRDISELLGTTPMYSNIQIGHWIDSSHLVLVGALNGGAGGTLRGIMIVDLIDKTLIDVGSSPYRPPQHITNTPFFEWIASSSEEDHYVSYNALTNERETLFDIPADLSTRTVQPELTYALSNRLVENLQADYLALSYRYFPGNDNMAVEIYELASGELLHQQLTNNDHISLNWVTPTRLLILDTERARPGAIVIDMNEQIQTVNISTVYENVYNSHYPSWEVGIHTPFRALSPDNQYMLLQPNEATVTVLDLVSMQELPFIHSYPQGYALELLWKDSHSLSARLLQDGTVMVEWCIRLETGQENSWSALFS